RRDLHSFPTRRSSDLTHSVPIGMNRQVHKLTTFIKPAAPTPQTAELIHNNTTHWMHQNMHILQNHYTSQISSLLQTTSPYNNTAFQIASGWARKRFRLSDTTLTTALYFTR